MSELKFAASNLLDEMHRNNRIDYAEYSLLWDALNEIESLSERDAALEDMWRDFGDVPMSPETERMEQPFMRWPANTPREDIWHWFDERHSEGVAYLLYGRKTSKSNDIGDSQRWVKVSKQLPERDKDVLMLFASGNMAVGWLQDIDERTTFWCAYTGDGWCTNCDSAPKYWMPLQEWPKGD